MGNHNFVVMIEHVGDELEMYVHPEFGALEQTNRRAKPGRKKNIKEDKEKRHKPGHKHPDVLGPHVPFFLIDKSGDTDNIIFRCTTHPFVIDVEVDEGFEVEDNPPRSPFGWTTPQTSTVVAGVNEVPATYAKNGNDPSSKHKFYKCTVWSGNKKLDPDFICDR